MRRKRLSDPIGYLAAQTNGTATSAVQGLPVPGNPYLKDVCYGFCISMQKALSSKVLAVASTHISRHLCLLKYVAVGAGNCRRVLKQ